MPKRKRDAGRTYKSGSEKRKAKLAKENLAQELGGFMEKPVNEQDVSDCEFTSSEESESHSTSPVAVNNPEESISLIDSQLGPVKPDCVTTVPAVPGSSHSLDCRVSSVLSGKTTENVFLSNYADIGSWPQVITSAQRDFLITKGPQNPQQIEVVKDESGRRFSCFHFVRKLANG